MKIAYFINQYPKISHSFIRREIIALELLGFEVQRIALRGWNESLPDPEDAAEQRRTSYVLRYGLLGLIAPTLVTLVRSPIRLLSAVLLAIKLSRSTDHRLLHHLVCIAEASCTVTLVKRYGAVHLHAHFGTNSAEVAMFANVLGRVPYSFTVHGPDEFLRPMALDEKIHRCRFAVTISSFGRSQLYLRSPHAAWPKIHVVHCGLERSFYDGFSSPLPISPRFVCVGRLCEAKGQLLLIEAAARMAAKGMIFELVLVGDGALRIDIERLVKRFGLVDKVRISGWLSSAGVRKEILAARALVLPTFAEGLPVVIMEAMALRRPVLTTYVAGIPELVRPGADGWLFPAGCVDALTHALEECLATPDEDLQRMGEAGHHRIIERHSIESETRKLENLFRTAAFSP
ncbi:MAG TPA: glycosyltransferase family 4 protein [Xanthobacteraceae bacterium]|nr:glycosyltransferase family 4 protein [Xanthobacteraceae bacterium]